MKSLTQKENCSCGCHNHNIGESPPVSRVKSTMKSLPSMVVSILIAFFPKCPLCWAVYMSMFGSIGLAKLPYMGWLLPVLFVFLGVHLLMIYRKSARGGYAPFFVSLAGASIILSARLLFPLVAWLSLTGMVFIISGSLLNSFSHFRVTTYHKLT